MIKSFADDGTEDIFYGRDTRAARLSCPRLLWPAARKRLDKLVDSERLAELTHPPGNRLKKLKGGRLGYHSIRINDQYRVVFWWLDGAATEVQILDYH